MAGKEVLWLFVYLLTTQLILGLIFETGLHFPGPDIYQQADHRQGEVITWIALNGVVYVALPLFWLNRVGFRFKSLFFPGHGAAIFGSSLLTGRSISVDPLSVASIFLAEHSRLCRGRSQKYCREYRWSGAARPAADACRAHATTDDAVQ